MPAQAIVRLSRALGLPERLPDLFGLAVRIPDAYGPGRHQDLLMATSGTSPLTRYALLPARSVTDRPYTTLLPYRLRGELVIIGARPVQPAQPGPDLSELRRRDRAELEFELVAGRPAGPPWPVARLSLERRLGVEETERLAFDPTNTGGGLELAGLVNRLRGPSYRGSQAGRGIHLEERIDSMSEEERKTKAR